MTRHLTLAAGLLAFALPVAAAPDKLVLTPDNTKISFLLKASDHDVNGTLKLKEGELSFERGSATASGHVVMDATSAETANAKRDKKMHAQVLETKDHPAFVFDITGLSAPLAASGASHVDLVGKLAIHGATHDVTVPADVTLDGGKVKATATITIPYVEWGMKDPSFLWLTVEKTVAVTIAVDASASTP
jgi:polyisoprenoid-binding protein YceI